MKNQPRFIFFAIFELLFSAESNSKLIQSWVKHRQKIDLTFNDLGAL